MKFNMTIPDSLKHLKTDERGYPIPFFVAYRNGKPDFRYLDPHKQELCLDKHLCAICGKKMGDYAYFISGPIGVKNRVATDPGMHLGCAEFSMRACPHLFYEKADRREDDTYDTSDQVHLIKEKPSVLLIVKAKKYKRIPNPNVPQSWLIKFWPVSLFTFSYVQGLLTIQGHEQLPKQP